MKRRDDTSEQPWGRLAVRSVEQLLNAKHFPFPSQGHTDGEESQDSKDPAGAALLSNPT